MSRPPVRRTMFSKPLAYPSTLDRRLSVVHTGNRRPTWRSFGAGVVRSSVKIPGKSTPFSMVGFFGTNAEVFLSQAGPRWVLMSSQAGHHLRPMSIAGASRNDEGDPWGRPRLAWLCASSLACMPPGEGYDVVVPRLLFGVAGAWRHHRDRRRVADWGLGIRKLQRHLLRSPRRIEHRQRNGKRSERRSNLESRMSE